MEWRYKQLVSFLGVCLWARYNHFLYAAQKIVISYKTALHKGSRKKTITLKKFTCPSHIYQCQSSSFSQAFPTLINAMMMLQ